MFDYLKLGEGNRLYACVDSLGVAKRLTVIGDYELCLETDRGTWILDSRALEPAFEACGYVGVGLPALGGKKALYLDLRIVAALLKARVRLALTGEERHFEKGEEIALYSEVDSLEIIRREMKGDAWSLVKIAESTTWVDGKGVPIPIDLSYDINTAIFFGEAGNTPIGDLDTRIWLLCMLTKPEEDELDATNPYGYLKLRMSRFFSARYVHNAVLAKYLTNPGIAPTGNISAADLPRREMEKS